jgi:RimJ/RimL family protein N-acetyltransferase
MTDRQNLFRGKLVRLVAPSERDAPLLARWSEDAGYLRAMDTDYARPLSPEEFAIRLSPDQADPNRLEFHLRTLDDERLIGFVALHSVEWNNGAALLAVGIGEPEYRGKGYGTDALQLILRFAFHELNLFRVGLDVIATNTRAIGAYEKLGFQCEGRMRGAVLREGCRTDRIFMGILRDEWSQLQQAASSQTPAPAPELKQIGKETS